ncbi:ArfGap-domain-containing protein [Viridothelium virens]|uniref:ArfGap-domain-containing protein n=1 Tax=Viridothelium virens TaxID=1048519 RepID=A0A6A6HQI4_VIRVR|nr:ArfGap-domain-containing protein [Viridothelium virens]
MSRRANPAPSQTEENRREVRGLADENKKCADCKQTNRPRWASWNNGVFICIRCSGIHRGLGTHISRVKSVDLDSWTDEQTQNMRQWGNIKGNMYWEAKLAPEHVPSEAKIQNFIRTKYDLKRWAMDGGMPDPLTLVPEAGDDVPLNIVKKAQLERLSSKKAAPLSQSVRTSKVTAPIDLFGDDPVPTAPPRPNTTEPLSSRAPPPPKADSSRQQPKQTDSLLGLDFLGGSASAPPARPNSATSVATNPPGPSRPDLKQSILSLYASAPRPQPQQSSQNNSISSFGNPQSPPAQTSQQASSFGGLSDAFSGLTFSAAPQQPQPKKPSPFAGLTSPPAKPSTSSLPSFGNGGNFFSPPPNPPPTAPKAPASQPIAQPMDDFGDFSSATSPITQPTQQKSTSTPSIPPPTSSPGMDDLFDLNAPAPPPASTKPKSPSRPPENFGSPFNLSSPSTPSAPSAAISQPSKPSTTTTTTTTTMTPSNPPLPTASAFSNMDAWGSNEAWGTPDPAPAPQPVSAPETSRPAPVAASSGGDVFGGWGAATVAKPAEPKVSADEDFGGWSSAPDAGGNNSGTGGAKPVGGFGGGNDDLFSNVWE